VLVVIGASTLLQRKSQYAALAKETETLAIPTVAVIHPVSEPAEEGLTLPERCRPMWNHRFTRGRMDI
jgi:hypothetical protein